MVERYPSKQMSSFDSRYSLSFLRNMKPVEILLLISELEGSYQHTKKLGFDEDRDVLRGEMCDRYYKLYFKLKKEQPNPQWLSGSTTVNRLVVGSNPTWGVRRG